MKNFSKKACKAPRIELYYANRERNWFESMKFSGCLEFLPTWRNWQTRTVQVRVPQGLWVRLPPSVPNCGYGISAVHQPSKLVRGVRPPLPAPFGGIPEWLKGADCKSAGSAFDGSNPSPTTILKQQAPQTRCFFCLIVGL